MALKKKLTKEAYDVLEDGFKVLYKEDAEGYALDLEGEEDIGAALRAKEHEKNIRKEAEARVKALQNEIEKIREEKLRNNGDIEALDKSWKAKFSESERAFKEQTQKYRQQIANSIIDNTVTKLCADLTQHPKLLEPHLRGRFNVNMDGETPVLQVLDKEGKPSALSVDDLKAEFVNDRDFSAIITVTKASGGAGKSAIQGSALPRFNQQPEKPLDLSKASPSEIVAHLDAKNRSENDT